MTDDGSADTAKGRIKQAAGDLTGDRDDVDRRMTDAFQRFQDGERV
jgi:uncharacterized protein YjbJ (UPF0337 family)